MYYVETGGWELNLKDHSYGTLEPMDCRLTPEDAFSFDEVDPGRSAFWKDVARQLLSGELGLIPDRAKQRFEEGLLYPCSIANQHVFITSDLHMQGCVRASYRKFDLRKGSVDEGWAYLQRELVNKKSSPDFKCRTCKNIRFCEQCTANFGQVFGDEEKVDEFYCKLAALRRGLVERNMKELLE